MRRFLFLPITIFVVVAFGFILASKVEASTYYVAGDTGNDTTGDGSSGNPWKTIQKPADLADAGDIINIKGGVTYTDTVDCFGTSTILCLDLNRNNSGSAGNLIVYQAWSGTGTPVLDASGKVNGIYIDFRGYYRFIGLEIKNATGSGMDANAREIEITNSLFHNNGDNGLNLTVFNSTGTIQGNSFYNNTDNGLSLTTNAATTSTIVQTNKAYNNGDNGMGVTFASNAGTFVIKNNLLYNNSLSGPNFNGINLIVDSTASGLVYNNTIYSADYGIGVQVLAGTAANTMVKNNVIFNSTTCGLAKGGGSNFTGNYNLFYNNGSNYCNIPAGANDITGQDPLLTNPAGGDFTQTGTSPTINTGTNTSVTTDFLGRTRPGGGTYDIGAYEYKTFYVAGDTGDDTTGRGTTALPWATIQKAATGMVAGDTVNIKGGLTYGTSTCAAAVVCPVNSGTSSNYITYQAWSGTGMPIISPVDLADDPFEFGAKSYIKIDGFKMYLGNRGMDLVLLTGVIISNNIIDTNQNNSGIQIIVGTNNKIYNNVIYRSGLGITAISETNLEIKNNIFMNNAVNGITMSGGTYTIDYNLFYNNGVSNCEGCILGSHDITGQDPLFVNAAGGDYSLQRGSPARNAGTTLADVTEDIVEVTRPQGSAYDIGAYEWYDVAVSLTALSPDPTDDNTPTLSGTVTTSNIATISSVEYSIDGGAWTSSGVTASDGTFNEVSEAFTITVSPSLTDGSHTIRVRGTDSELKVTDSSIYGTDTFTIDTTGPGDVIITDIGLIDDVPNLDSLYYYFTSQTPVIQGTCEANGTVYFLNTTTGENYSIGCSATGTFSITIDNPELERTLSEFDYYQKDSVGNSGSTRYLALVIGVENFPEWLLIQLGLNPDTVTPDTEVNEEDLDKQNDQQDDVEDSMDDDFDLPGTGDDDDEDKDTRTEEEKDADRQKDLVKDLLLCGIPLVLLLVILGASFYFLSKPKNEKKTADDSQQGSIQ